MSARYWAALALIERHAESAEAAEATEGAGVTVVSSIHVADGSGTGRTTRLGGIGLISPQTLRSKRGKSPGSVSGLHRLVVEFLKLFKIFD